MVVVQEFDVEFFYGIVHLRSPEPKKVVFIFLSVCAVLQQTLPNRS